MFPHAYDFHQYYLSDSARAAAGAIRRRISHYWPVAKMQNAQLLGLGYALPYLAPYINSPSVFAALPASFGPLPWETAQGTNRSCVVTSAALPFENDSLDAIMAVHALDFAEDPQGLLGELWRTLKPQGRGIIIVPNRHGFWSRSEITPFGHGRPYTLRQASQLLNDARFTLERHTSALLLPPITTHNTLGKLARKCDMLTPCVPALGGVLIIEVSKRVYAPIPRKVKESTRHVAQPVMVGVNSRH